MSGTPAVIDQLVHARLLLTTHRSAPLRVTLRYRADDPLALRMLFPAEYTLDGDEDPWNAGPEPDPAPTGTEIEWVFARHLLAAGLDLPAGLGDVHVRPAAGGWTMVELRSAEGTALLRFESAALSRFLWRSYVVVPEGQELRGLDPDRELAELLG
ncbi:SsgA family sporulation/cell division regulator [Kitasatospora paracochleata]|uniref:Sporulation and cell division protein SsgA n=1 Tax=Kitasatospora paracochleata TaxID=58354 RepID=A0ABT1IY80_9ACTN|nr:SsgA family sporulation/cell division regulator [Kitasatospora paracochleata]MCP2310102.1 hypothetical protein [Kitasatospora paracochleata]